MLNRTASPLKRTIVVAARSMMIAVVIVVFAVPYALVRVGQSAAMIGAAGSASLFGAVIRG